MTEKELIPLLCRTWKINYDKSYGKITRTFPKAKQYDITFKSDFTFIVQMDDRKTVGEWCYETENKCVSISMRGESVNQVALVDKYQLIMIMRKDAKKKGKLFERNHGQFVPK